MAILPGLFACGQPIPSKRIAWCYVHKWVAFRLMAVLLSLRKESCWLLSPTSKGWRGVKRLQVRLCLVSVFIFPKVFWDGSSPFCSFLPVNLQAAGRPYSVLLSTLADRGGDQMTITSSQISTKSNPTWVQISSLPLLDCIILGKLLNLSELSSSARWWHSSPYLIEPQCILNSNVCQASHSLLSKVGC